MLYYTNICENYDDFKSRYYRNDGVTKQLRMNLKWAIFRAKMCHNNGSVLNNDALMRSVLNHLSYYSDEGYVINLTIDGSHYSFRSSVYSSDHLHCVRTDSKDGLRLIKDDRVWGVKYGKMFNSINEVISADRKVPQNILNYVVELFAYKWRAEHPIVEYTLHVDDNFERIYTSDEDFGSCMRNQGQWTFYRDAVDASACYLTDKDGEMVARAVRFNSVRDVKNNETLLLLERQYSKDSRGDLKQILVDMLIAAGEIDGYKSVTAGCADAYNFKSIGGDDWSCRMFEIKCDLKVGDTLSYQDSFKWYDYDNRCAYNYPNGDQCLNTTDDKFMGTTEEYLYWNGYDYDTRYASRVWIEDHCTYSEVADAYLDDGVWIDGYFYPYNDDNICYSDYHAEYFYKSECTFCDEENDWFRDYEVVTDINGKYRYEGHVYEITYGENKGKYSDNTVDIKIDGRRETVYANDENCDFVKIGKNYCDVYITDEGKVFLGTYIDPDDIDMAAAGFVKVEDEWYTKEAALEVMEELEEC